MKGHKINDEIFGIYDEKKKSIKQAFEENDIEKGITLFFELQMFMNRFRNCDLQQYYDEELQYIVKSSNPRTFNTDHLLKPKKVFRIAFLVPALVDTGGASVPHRFMLNELDFGDVKFEQYLLVTNVGRKSDIGKNTHQYDYIQNEMNLKEFHVMDPIDSWVERGEYIENWLYDRQIDFAVVGAEPSVIYAMGSKPVLFVGVLPQDCYTYTVGPGSGDINFYVTTDQLLKYEFSDRYSSSKSNVVMLPVFSDEYVENTEPMDLTKEFGIPGDAVVSATSNLWKSCFGDAEVLFEGIAELVRKHPNYHHLFFGTPRCLDNLQYFLNKNPDVKGNIHFIGIVKNVYKLLKAIDFFVNSYPTSGGSDIESAIVGKPSIEFLCNRNLTLHGCEFLRTPECEAASFEEFIKLGSRFITDKAYRDDLGIFLQQKIKRDFNKNWLVKEKIYDRFVEEFKEKLADRPQKHIEKVSDIIEYEKHLALYNTYGREQWAGEKKEQFLLSMTERWPGKSFAWIKLFELCYESKNSSRFDELVNSMPEALNKDYRVCYMMAINSWIFDRQDKAFSLINTSADLSSFDTIPAYRAAKWLLEVNKTDEANSLILSLAQKEQLTEKEIEEKIKQFNGCNLPIYYNY